MRAVLHGALCVITCFALWAIGTIGFALPALLLLPLVARALWQLRMDRAAGALLCWRAGVWTLEKGGELRVISPLLRCTVTPWVIYLVFTDISARSTGNLWLYADSAAAAQIRRLRVRLTLLR